MTLLDAIEKDDPPSNEEEWQKAYAVCVSKAKFRKGQGVIALRDHHYHKQAEGTKPQTFAPGTEWKIVRVFAIQLKSGNFTRRYRLAAHGISVVATEGSIYDPANPPKKFPLGWRHK